MPVAPVAAGSLVAGYGVAAGTGVRPLGGLVFLAGTTWSAQAWFRRSGPGAAVVLTGLQLGAFIGSHRLAKRIGAWPSVLAVAAASGGVAALADLRRSSRPNPLGR